MKGSEREIEGRAADRWTLRNGEVTRFQGYDTPAEGLEAAGLAGDRKSD